MSYKVTILPEYVGIVEKTSINFYNTSTNILDAIGGYLAELNQVIEFEKAKVTPDLIASWGNLYNTLNASKFIVPDYTTSGTVNGVKQLDNNFKMYFIERYQSLSDQYKAKISALIPNNVYFKDFSDDTGMISDVVSVFDNSVNPIFDTYGALYFTQTNLPATLINKVSDNELKLLKTASYYGDILLKKNLNQLQSSLTNQFTAQTSHGTNLITDILYYNRAIVNQISILNVIKSVLGDLTGFVFFFKQLNPKDQDENRKAIAFKFTETNMEGVEVKVDALHNQLDKVMLSTQSVLQ